MIISIILSVVYGVLLITSTLAYTSVFEWTLHRYVMHRPFGRLTYPYRSHALVHHQLFRADATYELRSHENQEDKWTIAMAWWNWLVLVPLAALPFILVSLFGTWIIAVTAVAVISGYYGLYEYLHWCMHLPKERRLERLGLFRRLNGHHLLHHRYMNRNFNVVLPFADLMFRTLLARSPKYFEQARSASVPDVQPRPPRVSLVNLLK